MMTLTFLPLPLPFLHLPIFKMDHLEGEGKTDIDGVAFMAEDHSVEGVRLLKEEE